MATFPAVQRRRGIVERNIALSQILLNNRAVDFASAK